MNYSIAHVGYISRTETNGVAETILGLLDYAPAAWSLEIWSPDHSKTIWEEKDVSGATIFHLPAYSRTGSILKGLPRETRDFLSQRARNIDIIHAHSVYSPRIVRTVNHAARFGPKVVLTPNGGYMPQGLKRRALLKQIWNFLGETRFVKRCNALHAVNPEEARLLAEQYGHPNILYIPNAARVEPDVEKTIPHREWKILYVGRLTLHNKGLDLLLHGYARARQKLGERLIPLEMYGRDWDGGKKDVKRVLKETSLESIVPLSEAIFGEEKKRVVRTASVFVHTSRVEGLPFAVLEALASGCPVLVTPETNLASEVERYQAGWVCAGNPESIAVALEKISACSRDELACRASNAVRLATECFSWHAVIQKMAEAYQNVMENCCSSVPLYGSR